MMLACTPGMPKDVAEEFDRLAKLFERTATDIDAISLELLASNLAMWRKATRDVDALGQVVMSGGIAIANPAIAISERAQVQVRAMIAELGISAAFSGRWRAELPHQLGHPPRPRLAAARGIDHRHHVRR